MGDADDRPRDPDDPVPRTERVMASRDERGALDVFRPRYAVPASDVAAEIERRVIGVVWGANGYTTVDQADDIGRRLGLGPDDTLLDVGTGRGWPALYLAATTGCRVVGTDMPMDALRAGVARSRREGLDGRAAMVGAAAGSLPFRPASFDAITHTDVL
jgi:SAM-dependent methyltransferase